MNATVGVKGDGIACTPVSGLTQTWLGLLLVATFALLPVYLFPSGGYQIVDILLAVTVVTALFWRGAPSFFSPYLLWIVPFISWAFLVNALQFLRRSDIWFAKATAILVYGPTLSFAFARVFALLLRKGSLPYAYCGALASILACLAARGDAEAGRAALSFNDPNQLGYFAAILQGFILILRGYRRSANIASVWYDLADSAAVLFAHIFLALSFSRSAMGAFLVLDLCLLKTMVKDPRGSVGFWILLVLSPLYFTAVDSEFIQRRLDARPRHFEADVFLQDLKARIGKPLHAMKGLQIVVGTGAGLGYQREQEIAGTIPEEPEEIHEFLAELLESQGLVPWQQEGAIESHNLFADIFRAYGLVGLMLFLPWILKLVWDSRGVPDALWVWTALMTYNMGNNGIRFRSLWILIALIAAVQGLGKQST